MKTKAATYSDLDFFHLFAYLLHFTFTVQKSLSVKIHTETEGSAHILLTPPSSPFVLQWIYQAYASCAPRSTATTYGMDNCHDLTHKKLTHRFGPIILHHRGFILYALIEREVRVTSYRMRMRSRQCHKLANIDQQRTKDQDKIEHAFCRKSSNVTFDSLPGFQVYG